MADVLGYIIGFGAIGAFGYFVIWPRIKERRESDNGSGSGGGGGNDGSDNVER